MNSESLDFKFLLKPRYSNSPCLVEEGPNRLLSGGMLQGDTRMALFRLSADEVLEYRVFIKADRVSPFDLAASWRAYQDNLRPSAVRGIPDVSMNSVSETGPEVSFLPPRLKKCKHVRYNVPLNMYCIVTKFLFVCVILPLTIKPWRKKFISCANFCSLICVLQFSTTLTLRCFGI